MHVYVSEIPRLYLHAGYELERCHSPGQPIDLNSTLESQGTLDFNLVKNVGKWLISLNTSNLLRRLLMAV